MLALGRGILVSMTYLRGEREEGQMEGGRKSRVTFKVPNFGAVCSEPCHSLRQNKENKEIPQIVGQSSFCYTFKRSQRLMH
jgi:hypothetical protein